MKPSARLRAEAAIKTPSKPGDSKNSLRKYSTREPDWEEYQTLPKRFHENGPGVWPAERIIGQKGKGKQIQYLVEWEAHPHTGEEWEPGWISLACAKEVSTTLLDEWEKRQRASTSRALRATAHSPKGRRVSRAVSGDTAGPPRRRQRRHTRIIDSSSDTERGTTSTHLSPPVSSRLSAKSSSASFEVQETQQAETTRVEIRVPPPQIDKDDYESLKSSAISLDDSALDQACLVEDRTATQDTQNSQLSSSSKLDSRAKSSLPSPARSSAVAEDSTYVYEARITHRSNLLPRSRLLTITTGITSGTQLESETQVSSPATTATSSDLFYPSPIRENNTPQSSSSPPGGHPFSSLQGGSIAARGSVQEGTVAQILESSNLSPKQVENLIPSAQPPFEIVNDSQRSTNNLQSITLPAAFAQNSTPSTFQTQIPFARTIPVGRITKSSSQDSGVIFAGTLPAGTPRDRENGRDTVSLSTGRVPYNSHKNKRLLFKSLQPSLSLPEYQSLQNNSSMATAAAEKSSPRLRSATPSTDRKLDTSSGFGERVYRARSARAEPKSQSVTPVRHPPPVILGGNNSPSSYARENTRQNNHAPASPLRHQLDSHIIKAGAEEPALVSSITRPTPVCDTALASSAMAAHYSVEEEDLENSNSTSDSGKMLIQQSIENEQPIPRMGGAVMPRVPILQSGEYTVSLPVDGRVQSLYNDVIQAKKRSLLRFIRKRSADGTRSANRTPDTIEMTDMIGTLNDVVTHVDLGLDSIGTQYPLGSEDNARYATYAGSKFAFLDQLINELRTSRLILTIFARPGSVHILLESFLAMKHVTRRRPLESSLVGFESTSQKTDELAVELLSSGVQTANLDIIPTPALIVAFDSSFDIQDPQIKMLRERSPDPPVPVIHLLIANSSEHIDRCLPTSMPSPQRLRLLVRATYQASRNLGGGPIIIPLPSENSDDRPMDYQELQKLLKKSPERRIKLTAAALAIAMKSGNFQANWISSSMPELDFDEIDESPPKSNRIRSVTPLSRAGTPSTRKRLLDVDNASSSTKRQRYTPLHDVTHISDSAKDASSQLDSLQHALDTAHEQLEEEKKARLAAEHAHFYAQKRLDEKTEDLANLLNRYETRMSMCHGLQKKNKLLQQELENAKDKQEKATSDHIALKDQVTQLKVDLATARANLKNAGGDVAAIELAEETARTLNLKNSVLEKSLANTKKDFEFTRSQYQEVSNRAVEFASQVSELESQANGLKAQASDEKRRLKEINYQENVKQHLARVAELEMERKNHDVVLKKLEDEVKALKKNRGVQTRGSSVQPPGSPRSRQASPAPGHFAVGAGASNVLGASFGGRASVLRHER